MINWKRNPLIVEKIPYKWTIVHTPDKNMENKNLIFIIPTANRIKAATILSQLRNKMQKKMIKHIKIRILLKKNMKLDVRETTYSKLIKFVTYVIKLCNKPIYMPNKIVESLCHKYFIIII